MWFLVLILIADLLVTAWCVWGLSELSKTVSQYMRITRKARNSMEIKVVEWEDE